MVRAVEHTEDHCDVLLYHANEETNKKALPLKKRQGFALLLGTAKSTKKLKIGYNYDMTVTVDLPPEVAVSLTQKAAQAGQDITGYIRQIAMREAQIAEPQLQTLRTPGLHAGQYWIADDFDAPA